MLCRCFSGGIDRTVKTYDFGSATDSVLGEHDKPVKAVCWQKDLGCCVSGSWDKTLKTWDTRQPNPCTSTSQLPDKVFTMSTTTNRIVVGTSRLLVKTTSRSSPRSASIIGPGETPS